MRRFYANRSTAVGVQSTGLGPGIAEAVLDVRGDVSVVISGVGMFQMDRPLGMVQAPGVSLSFNTTHSVTGKRGNAA